MIAIIIIIYINLEIRKLPRWQCYNKKYGDLHTHSIYRRCTLVCYLFLNLIKTISQILHLSRNYCNVKAGVSFINRIIISQLLGWIKNSKTAKP